MSQLLKEARKLPYSQQSLIEARKLSISQAARACGVHPLTMGRWTRHGVGGRVLPSIRVGGRRMILESDLEAFLADGRQVDTTAADDAAFAEQAEADKAQAAELLG